MFEVTFSFDLLLLAFLYFEIQGFDNILNDVPHSDQFTHLIALETHILQFVHVFETRRLDIAQGTIFLIIIQEIVKFHIEIFGFLNDLINDFLSLLTNLSIILSQRISPQISINSHVPVLD